MIFRGGPWDRQPAEGELVEKVWIERGSERLSGVYLSTAKGDYSWEESDATPPTTRIPWPDGEALPIGRTITFATGRYDIRDARRLDDGSIEVNLARSPE